MFTCITMEKGQYQRLCHHIHDNIHYKPWLGGTSQGGDRQIRDEDARKIWVQSVSLQNMADNYKFLDHSYIANAENFVLFVWWLHIMDVFQPTSYRKN